MNMKSVFSPFSSAVKYFYLFVFLMVAACSRFTGNHDNLQPQNTFAPDTLWTSTGDAVRDSLLQLVSIAPYDTNLALLYYKIGRTYANSDFEKAKEYYRKLDNLSQALNYGRGRYLYASDYALMLIRQGLADSALTISHEALDLARSEGDESRAAIFLFDLGNSYAVKGWSETALTYYMDVLAYSERTNKNNWLLQAYAALARIYDDLGSSKKAIEYGQKAVAIDSSNVYALLWLATAYYGGQQFEKARDYYEETLRLGKQQNNIYVQGSVYFRFADYALEAFELDEAEKYARQSLDIFKQFGRQDCCLIFIQLAKIEQARGNYVKSEAYVNEALQITHEFESANMNGEKKTCYMIHYALAVAQRKYRESRHYWTEISLIEKAIAQEATLRAAEEMAAKYETEKKELKISALEERHRFILLLSISAGAVLALALATLFFLWRLTVQKRQLAETRIVQLEKEKQLIATQALLDGETRERSRLARDLHDGLGSILTGAKLNLLEMKKGAAMDGDTLERYDVAVGMLDQSMSEMRRVAHHLMPKALTAVGLKQSTADFVASIPNATFSYYGDETRFDTKLEETVYRITHELVTNALKHSGAAQILVDIVRYDNHVTLAVQDDGCGFDPDAVTKGMGMSNIRTRIDAFGGNLTIVSKAGEGTEVNVEFVVS